MGKILLHKNTLAVIITVIMLFMSSLFTSSESGLRYIKYFLPFILGLYLVFFYSNLSIDNVLKNNVLLYTFLLLLNFIVSLFLGNIQFRFFKESLLILLPLISAVLITGIMKKDLNKFINILFWTYLISFISFHIFDFLNVVKLISSLLKALTSSELATESWLAFPLGLFSLYFLLENKKRMFLLALIFFVFAFKRISIIAFLIATFIFFLINYKLFIIYNKKKIVTLLIIINIIFITTIYLFIDGAFTRFIYRETGLTINHFTQGRFVVYKEALIQFREGLWYGNGLGSTNQFLSIRFKDIAFLHSDILKIIIEFGIILFIIWLVMFLIINLKGKKTLPLILFLNVLFLSDNVFIYFDTLFIFYIMIAKFNSEENVSKN
jgi:hypothetical protein